MELVVAPTGTVRCIYNEALPLSAIGRVAIRRGSHVEPDASSQWWADLAPVSGPTLGPFATRTAALDAEVHWLSANWLSSG
jgi:hypothetical protein